MWRLLPLILLTLAASMATSSGANAAECLRKIANEPSIKITDEELTALKPIKFNSRAKLFATLQKVAHVETGGCWDGATGDFDNQLLSVGAQQWNFGSDSLQPFLDRYYRSYPADGELLKSDLKKLMPNEGLNFLRSGCRQKPVSQDCKQYIRALETANGDLKRPFAHEVDQLFDSDLMVQFEMDHFVRLVESVSSSVKRVFRGRQITPLKMMWAIDLATQQGLKHFPKDRDLKPIRKDLSLRSETERQNKLLYILQWYAASCKGPGSGLPAKECDWNIRAWSDAIHAGINAEQRDLLCVSFVSSRTSTGVGGHWQALTFARRAKIVLGIGSVNGDKTPF